MFSAKGSFDFLVKFLPKKKPFVMLLNLLSHLTSQLEKDAKYASVYQLLKIFLTKRLDAYLDFHSSNSNLLDNHGLVLEDCITKMKLISLVDLGKNESGQISYSLIKETLQLSSSSYNDEFRR
ncbi:hypothetical protein OROMI_002875 [Orobanche minor]